MFSRVLIANRGEIALRVLRACKELGIQTVAVHSEADADASYLRLANRKVCIGPGPATESYLRSDRIIAAAELAGADAIHPGYGFLAENAMFAEQCRDCGIEFIGPSAQAMRLLGDKAQARKLAKRARVPTVPGSDGPIEDDQKAVEVAGAVGYPVLIKAVAGGGGRGMRVAHNDAMLRGALKQARQEAENAFKDSSVYIEKYLERPRHIEVQVLGDKHGNYVHLFERECSIQRRHQKLIEESPSPVITSKLRRDLCYAAVKLARAAEYYSAGTFEFLLDHTGRHFYFIEANARIQVEHPVTELVTGVDLVAWQLRIASGEKLALDQHNIRLTGHAIECRINAEDPTRGFQPRPGRIAEFIAPGGFGVRWDSHVYAGYEIPKYYDSLIGKLIVHRMTRPEAITCMRRCLEEIHVEPVATTAAFHRRVLDHEGFREGQFDTGFVERELLK
jgi:acetyl-CoA carboxylase biotin carboxylase subunit